MGSLIKRVKSQVLVDFIADFSTNILPEAENGSLIASETILGFWTLYTNGSSNVKGSGLGILIITLTGEAVQ